MRRCSYARNRISIGSEGRVGLPVSTLGFVAVIELPVQRTTSRRGLSRVVSPFSDAFCIAPTHLPRGPANLAHDLRSASSPSATILARHILSSTCPSAPSLLESLCRCNPHMPKQQAEFPADDHLQSAANPVVMAVVHRSPPAHLCRPRISIDRSRAAGPLVHLPTQLQPPDPIPTLASLQSPVHPSQLDQTPHARSSEPLLAHCVQRSSSLRSISLGRFPHSFLQTLLKPPLDARLRYSLCSFLHAAHLENTIEPNHLYCSNQKRYGGEDVWRVCWYEGTDDCER